MTDSPPRPPRPRTPIEMNPSFRTNPDQDAGQSPPRPAEPFVNPEQTVRSAMPGVTESKMFFEMFIFHPEESIPKAALIEVLKAAKLTFSPEIFYKMTPETQRQFLRLDRSGSLQRAKPSTGRAK